MKHYAPRDLIGLGKHYTNHVQALTAEDLHAKSDIAAELAHRDQLIEKLVHAQTGQTPVHNPAAESRAAFFEHWQLAINRTETAGRMLRLELVEWWRSDHACEGCGAPHCKALWPTQRKCCPDCSHK